MTLHAKIAFLLYKATNSVVYDEIPFNHELDDAMLYLSRGYGVRYEVKGEILSEIQSLKPANS